MNDTTVDSSLVEQPTGDPVDHAANLVVVTRDRRVLLAVRDRAPFVGLWGLPGGTCDMGEATDRVAVGRCREKTGVDMTGTPLVPVSSRDEGRDASRRFCTVSYAVLVDAPLPVEVGDAVREVAFVPVAEALARPMPWDHAAILREAFRALGLTVE
ncbi:NUDIX domain-containing protein [Amycolatopsis rubida]|uniref:ADP-ribose pyrophosphatase YjhB, NUDIX family n=1 Tax=Amycolatopsis rubida TaxID=112413 RepID=A0A1I5X9U0_9PSEU|nr:NUDIX domain-containing protein [Amycolatopsis rubida]SFQ28738.1 ADP-ribose pyrophosphatase YjhB, NUDIX family [Amycolatopsis rubida]